MAQSRKTALTIVGSRSHKTAELEAYVEEKRKTCGEVDFISAGSSLKICLVAEGRADIYPRLGPTMEWDTAAGQAIAEFAGAVVYEYETSTPLMYNKENLLNPWFIVQREI
jgi:3'(2'), 5'-bisphosphate nucleotidase